MDAPGHQGRGRAGAALPRPADRRLHRAAGGPAPPRGRDLVPRRPPGRARTRTCARPRCARPHEEIGLDPARRSSSMGALPPVGTFVTGYRIFPFVGLIERRPDLAPPGDRGRAGPRVLARRPRRGLRDAAADPQGRADQDAHLHGRRPPGLGSDRPDRAVAARARWRPACSKRPSRSARRPCCPTRSTSRRSSSRRRGRAARAARTRCAPSARRCGSRR